MAVYSRRVLPCFRSTDLEENHSPFQTDTKVYKSIDFSLFDHLFQQLLNLAGIILHPTLVSSMSDAGRPFLGQDSAQTREPQTTRDFWRNRSKGQPRELVKYSVIFCRNSWSRIVQLRPNFRPRSRRAQTRSKRWAAPVTGPWIKCT